MKNLRVSKRAQNVLPSPIRKFLPLLKNTESKGIKVFKLNVGDPDLSPPKEFLLEVKNYNQPTLGYAPSPGLLNHLLAWQKYYNQFGIYLLPENIIPTVGCAEAIMLVMEAVADFGDEIIVFEPLYVSYKAFATMAGIKLVPVLLSIQNNFAMPNLSLIEKKISKKTKAIVIINPDNPTGKLWNKQELKSIILLAKKHNLFIISDETYREIRFDGKKPVCFLTNKNAEQNIIVVDSVSKRFSLPGARIGCVASFNQEVMGSILKFAQARLSAGTLEQLGTAPLLNNSSSYVNKVVKEYQKRQKVVAQGLAKIKGTAFRPAMGAFYQAAQLPVKNAEDFVKFMISKFRYKNRTVMVTPMQDFYITPGLGKSEIRIAYVLNTKNLAVAMDLLKRGVEEYGLK